MDEGYLTENATPEFQRLITMLSLYDEDKTNNKDKNEKNIKKKRSIYEFRRKNPRK